MQANPLTSRGLMTEFTSCSLVTGFAQWSDYLNFPKNSKWDGWPGSIIIYVAR